MKIRRSTESDLIAIGDIHRSAFGREQGQEIVELVNGLLDDATAKPLLSLVAETDGRLVGHILFTVVRLQPGVTKSRFGFSPHWQFQTTFRAKASVAC